MWLECRVLLSGGATTLPGQRLGLPPSYQNNNFAPLAIGDFNNDGKADIVAADGVYLGTGDGTFQYPAVTSGLVDPTQDPSAIVVGDFNGDHKLDVAVALAGTDNISISLGIGDGTFQAATTIGLPAGSAPQAIVAGHFTSSGHLDLAVADTGTGDVTILLGNGDGTFQLPVTIPVDQGPVAIAVGNFLGHGRSDLAVANINSSDIAILANDGEGTFTVASTVQLPPNSAPTSLAAGDFWNNGKTDLAVTDYTGGVVDILQGHGDGTFSLTSSLTVGPAPVSIVAGSLGNNQIDLAVSDQNSNTVSVLIGNGDGSFRTAIDTATGTTPLDVVAGDFNADGRLDLATGNAGSNDISVLIGKGDGTFEGVAPNYAHFNVPYSFAPGDFTGNGKLGLAVLNAGSGTVTILPGNGDGTFQQPLTLALPAGSSPSAIVAGDFNNDGRSDLAIAEQGVQIDGRYGAVQIFLGNGDGTFDGLPPIPVAAPSSIVAGDFTGNHRIDLAVTDSYPSAVTILMGNGDGTFTNAETIPLGVPYNPSYPAAIVSANFGNGNVDLAVADQGTEDVTILMNDGQGNFTARTPISLGSLPFPPMSLIAGNFTASGYTDLAVATTDYSGQVGDSIQLLLGLGNGNFAPQAPISLGSGVYPIALVAGDFNNDGKLDLATANGNGNENDDVSVFMGDGNGGLSAPTFYALGGPASSTAIVAGNFAGSGRPDLAIARTSPDGVQVLLANGDGSFSDPSQVDLVPRDTPAVGDLNGDGALDVSVVDAAGNILFRAGVPGEPGTFAPPITVNPGDPSRDIAVVETRYGPALASVDAQDNAISFFTWRSTGFILAAKLTTGLEPAEIVAADLNGNSVADLVVRNAGDGTIAVHRGDGSGWFLPPTIFSVGEGASDVQVANLQQNGRLDIVYTDRLSGEVGVLRNLGGGAFSSSIIYAAGRGPYGSTGTAGPSGVISFEGTDSVTFGTLTPGGSPSIIALNPGSNTFGVLTSSGNRGFANASIFPTAGSGTVVRAVDLGNGVTGLAILTPDGLYIEPSDGYGEFLPAVKIDVGFQPNGLTVANLDGPGPSDLLIGNPRGDVLVLLAGGNGTFQPPRNLDQQVAMTATGPDLLTPDAFIYSDKSTDQLVVRTPGGAATVLADAQSGLVSPGAVVLADLNNNGIFDLIVADSGSNNVLVFPGRADGTFATKSLNGGHGFFTGTDPVGITVADVDGDGRPDLIVADKGSNEVSILLNKAIGNGFTFVPGERLKVGVGPVATAVADVYGNGRQDLVVANSGSNSVMVLPAIGNGFFNDQGPIVYPVGTNPTSVFVGNFTSGPGQEIAVIDSGSNTVSLVSNLGSVTPLTQSISSGGIDPEAAFVVPGASADSLVVANSGNGSISLFEGGANGLSLDSVLSTSGLPNPSALALASFSSSGIEFWTTNDGEQHASLVGFEFQESTAETESAGSSSATLVSLNQSSLALVGTLLTVTLDLQSETVEASEGAAALVASASGSAGQSLISTFRNPEEELEDLSDTAAAPEVQPAAAAWARYVSGVDQAIERVRSEAGERQLQEQQPAKSAAPGTTSLQGDAAAGQNGTAAFVEEAAIEAARRLQAERDRLQAIDRSLGAWLNESPTARRSPTVFEQPSIKNVSPVALAAVTNHHFSSPLSGSWFAGSDDRDSIAVAGRRDRGEPQRPRVARIVTLAGFAATALAAREGFFRRMPRRAGSTKARESMRPPL
jgi:hypothetical protein